MGFSDELHVISTAIWQQSSDLDGQISRLEQAKRAIDNEQNACMGEIRKVVQPELENDWTGHRGNVFDEPRDQSYYSMCRIIYSDYDRYKQDIHGKIMMLQAERSFLNFAGSVAYEAHELLEKGEEALEELGSKINDLKRWLF